MRVFDGENIIRIENKVLHDLRFNGDALTGFEAGFARLTWGIVDIEANVVAQVMRE